MGTYTTNYNLFMPSIGEQGWGELVNNNFSTIDTTIAGLNTWVGTLETETDAVEERVEKVEDRLGTGTYITGVTVPITVKLSTTDEGLGMVSPPNNDIMSCLAGFSVINPNDTYTINYPIYCGSGSINYTIYAINILNGTQRVAASGTLSYTSGVSYKNVSATLKVIEIPMCSNTHNQVTKPAIYINAVE